MDKLIYDVPKINESIKASFYSNKVILVNQTEYHSHNYLEIAFVESGSGEHKVAKDIFPCASGDIFLINHSVSHMFIPDKDSELVILNCIFLPEFFDYSLSGNKSFQTLSNIYLFRSLFLEEISSCVNLKAEGKDYEKIYNLSNDILTEYELKDTGYMELIRAYMIEYLIFILRKTQTEYSGSPFNLPNKELHSEIMQKVLSYMETHFSDDVTIGDLSVMAFLSPAQLCRVFKQTTGITIKEFMQKIRIETACRLLCETDKAIGEISEIVGYKDVKYFAGLFAKIIGKKPSEFRKTQKKARRDSPFGH